MRNEAGDIVQDHPEHSIPEWKSKAKAAGTAAWDATRATYEQLQGKTMEYSRATDRVIREKPYAAVGIAFGIGMVVGLLAFGGSSDREQCS